MSFYDSFYEDEDAPRYNDRDYKEMQADFEARREQLTEILGEDGGHNKEGTEDEDEAYERIINGFDLSPYLDGKWGSPKITTTFVMDGDVAGIITVHYGSTIYLEIKVSEAGEAAVAEVYSQPNIYTHESRAKFSPELWATLNNFFNT
jgi:hypothetical protein